MKRSEAPPPGWYPDPTRRGQLRWWDGLDWSEHRRPAPPPHSAAHTGSTDSDEQPSDQRARRGQGPARAQGTITRDETAAIMAEVRQVARDEADRALENLTNRARDATRQLEPLIGQYGDRAMKWLRNIGIAIVVLVVLWMVLQAGTQATLMDWIGDRIDNVLETR